MESNFSLIYGNLFLICISLFLIFRTIKSNYGFKTSAMALRYIKQLSVKKVSDHI